jgi:hypothetical protein
MRRQSVLVAVAVLVGIVMAPTAAFSKPEGVLGSKPGKVPLCHFDEEAGTFELMTVPDAGRALEAHLDHGDLLPGTGGLDGDCGPNEGPLVFAIAYTDMDTGDGDGFKDGVDVLISKLVDSNGDGVVSRGDIVVTGHSPFGPDPSDGFIEFPVQSHTVSRVVYTFSDGVSGQVEVWVRTEVDGVSDEFALSWYHVPDPVWLGSRAESYIEATISSTAGGPITWSQMVDDLGGFGFENIALNDGDFGVTASFFGTDPYLVDRHRWEAPGNSVDGAFIDVEIALP